MSTAAAEGCPIESPDGLSLYIASNRGADIGPEATESDEDSIHAIVGSMEFAAH